MELVSSARTLLPMNHEHHIGGRMVRSENTLFLRQDPHALAVLGPGITISGVQKIVFFAVISYQALGVVE